MAKITAADVNQLRKMTGAGMMDCKKALQETDGDFEKAKEYLRKKGQKIADKRADKQANEGVVLAKITDDKKRGVVVMLSCETDFVAGNEEFVALVNNIIDLSIANKAKNIDEVNNMELDGRPVVDHVTDLMGKIGEKMEVADFQFVEAEKVFAYNHNGNKLATIIGFNKADADDEAGKQIAMQIAAMNPIAIDKDSVSQEIIDKEIEIGKEIALKEGKPENIVEKIAMGKVNKFLAENTLLNQAFVRDNKQTVGQFIKSVDSDLAVTSFKRVAFGD